MWWASLCEKLQLIKLSLQLGKAKLSKYSRLSSDSCSTFTYIFKIKFLSQVSFNFFWRITNLIHDVFQWDVTMHAKRRQPSVSSTCLPITLHPCTFTATISQYHEEFFLHCCFYLLWLIAIRINRRPIEVSLEKELCTCCKSFPFSPSRGLVVVLKKAIQVNY